MYLDKMAKLQDAAATVVDVAAYGTLDSSRALGQKFYDMMCGSRADSPSLVDAYQMRIDEIRRAQIEFTKYFQAAESHDGATAAAIRQHQL